MPRVEMTCDYCGKRFMRYPSKLYRRHFCCRACLAKFTSKTTNPDGYRDLKDYTAMSENMARINREYNPRRMDFQTRTKLRNAHLNTGEGKTYEKKYSVHTHRRMAVFKLGRQLRPGEVVHHIDGNKRNNDPKNLMIFESQKAHAKYHQELIRAAKRGDAE